MRTALILTFVANLQGDGHVFHGMNRDVDPSIQQGLLQFLDEQALAADLGQGGIENNIALGGHFDQLYLKVREVLLQACAHMFCLPQGELAFAGTNA